MLLIAVQFQQLLPHGERRPVSRTAFRVCPQQAEVLEAEGLKAREFPWAAGHPTPHPIPAARLQQTGKSSGGSVRRGLAGADGRKPGLYVRLGIAVFQAVQTDIPFPTGGKDSFASAGMGGDRDSKHGAYWSNLLWMYFWAPSMVLYFLLPSYSIRSLGLRV